MGIRQQLTLGAACMALFISGCNKLDMRGMFISYDDVDDRITQSLEWNETHPFRELVVTSEEYSLFAMGDSHIGGTQNLDSFIASAKNEQAAAVVMVGDLTTGQSEDFVTYADHLPDSSLPCFNIVGNHDLYYGAWDDYFQLFGSSTYAFTVKTPSATDLYLCLDTGSGSLGKVQMDWLEDMLEVERPKYRHCGIFTHNNFYRFRKTGSTNPVLEELHHLFALFAEHDVDLMVMAHDHRQDVEVFGATTYITMDALLDLDKNAGYLVLDVSPSGFVHDLRKI